MFGVSVAVAAIVVRICEVPFVFGVLDVEKVNKQEKA
jgi:hypothetical protein